MKSRSLMPKNLADRVCGLECAKDQQPTVEFVGPVKIVLVDPSKKENRRKSCGAAFIALANLMMGASNITILYYTLGFKLKLFVNLHIVLCTIGYQLCFPSAILLLNSLNGASSGLKLKQRKFQHLFLQLFGLGCGAAGSALVFLDHFKISKFTFHSITGVASGGIAVLAVLTGLIIYCTGKGTVEDVCKFCHMSYGVLSFILSSVCFVSGLLRPVYSKWVPLPEMLAFPIIFCVFVTIVVVFGPVYKVLKKMDYF
ncbi:uncharacterized protein LOC114249085 [Bombyx mandarina]|uniref:ascorbate ferrireductase (transmembrane) n=1 Tax=Bombyx mandarina TaxID=7092 RepID=A0A6J2K7U1_BOMMA|nr:uncharacterized protein LOC114249085 [Bombyx mandarina]